MNRPTLILAILFFLGGSTAAPAEIHLNFYYTSGALNCDELPRFGFAGSVGLHSPVIASDGSEYNFGVGIGFNEITYRCEDVTKHYKNMTSEEQRRYSSGRTSDLSLFLRKEVGDLWQEAAIGTGFTRKMPSGYSLWDHRQNHLQQIRYFYGYRFLPKAADGGIYFRDASIFAGFLYQKFSRRQCVLDSECAENQIIPTNTQKFFFLLGMNFGG